MGYRWTPAGELNRRIAIIAKTEEPDGEGGRRKVESLIGEFWAKIEPLTGTESVFGLWKGAIQRYGEVTHAIRMRYQPGVAIDGTMTIRYGGRELHIVSVLDVEEAHKELLIAAVEGV